MCFDVSTLDASVCGHLVDTKAVDTAVVHSPTGRVCCVHASKISVTFRDTLIHGFC